MHPNRHRRSEDCPVPEYITRYAVQLPGESAAPMVCTRYFTPNVAKCCYQYSRYEDPDTQNTPEDRVMTSSHFKTRKEKMKLKPNQRRTQKKTALFQSTSQDMRCNYLANRRHPWSVLDISLQMWPNAVTNIADMKTPILKTLQKTEWWLVLTSCFTSKQERKRWSWSQTREGVKS